MESKAMAKSTKSKTTADVAQRLSKARKSGCPLVAVDTSEPRALMTQIAEAMQNGTARPVFAWDIVRGLWHLNPIAKEYIPKMLNEFLGDESMPGMSDVTKGNPVTLGEVLQYAPEDSCCFMLNAHEFITDPSVAQAIWNLRDAFKSSGRILVMLSPLISLPPQLRDDVLVFDDPLPSESELSEIVASCHAAVEVECDEESSEKAIDALRGLNAFTAEQATSLNLFRDESDNIRLDHDGLWDTKRKLIEGTNGLSIYRPTETWDDIKGNANVKSFTRDLLHGEDRPRCIVWLDEFEKAQQGAGGGDLSGTSDDQLQITLEEMEDNQYEGMIYCGHPGTGKSMIAKCSGSLSGIPVIKFDLGAVKAGGQGLVGGAEREIRAAFKVIKAVSGGDALFIATTNGIASLKPELRARFTFGTFMFDFFSDEEREAAWEHHIKAYRERGMTAKQVKKVPEFAHYTGREIRNICKIAYRTKRTLEQATTFVSPYAKTDPQNVRQLREQAHGRFIDAANDGMFMAPDGKTWGEGDKPGKRTIEV